ncbi:MAG: antitoxin [bacterium]|nr:antitoxin [bacterium]
MTKKQFNPVYDTEELEIMNELEQGERTSVKDIAKEKARYAHYAKNTIEKMNKRKAISIRIFEENLIKIKAKAQALGIPYQTYISSELHKLVA